MPDARQQTRDKLTYWRERLIEHDCGLTNGTLTRAEITGQLDFWLDAMFDHLYAEAAGEL